MAQRTPWYEAKNQQYPSSLKPDFDAVVAERYCEQWEEYVADATARVERGETLPQLPPDLRFDSKRAALEVPHQLHRIIVATMRLCGDLTVSREDSGTLKHSLSDAKSELARSKADARKLCDRVSELMKANAESLETSRAEAARLQARVDELEADALPRRGVQSMRASAKAPTRIETKCRNCERLKAEEEKEFLSKQKLREDLENVQIQHEKRIVEIERVTQTARQESHGCRRKMQGVNDQSLFVSDRLRQLISHFGNRVSQSSIEEPIPALKPRTV